MKLHFVKLNERMVSNVVDCPGCKDFQASTKPLIGLE